MICLCGIPASGKTTFLKRLMSIYPSAMVVQFDSFLTQCNYEEARFEFYKEMAALSMRYTFETFGVTHLDGYREISAGNLAGTAGALLCDALTELNSQHECYMDENLQSQYSPDEETEKYEELAKMCQFGVVCEHTFEHASSRSLAVRMTRLLAIPCIFVHFPLDLTIAIARNRQRGEPVSIQSIENVAAEFDPFGPDDPVVTVNASLDVDLIIANIRQMLSLAWMQSWQNIPKVWSVNAPQEPSLAHEFDLETRKAIGEVLETAEYREYASELNEFRRDRVACFADQKQSDIMAALAHFKEDISCFLNAMRDFEFCFWHMYYLLNNIILL